MRRQFCVLAFVAAAAAVPTASSLGQSARDAGAASPTAEQLREMQQASAFQEKAKAFVRRHAELFYGGECPGLSLPDEAFLPVEVDGNEATREIAVTFGRARCRDQGHNMFAGTGGVMVQLWQVQGDRPALLLQQTMHGFTAQAPYVVTLQHGGACPGGAGPSPCRIIYRWDALGRRFETENRQLLDDGWVAYDNNRLTGADQCAGRSRRGVCR